MITSVRLKRRLELTFLSLSRSSLGLFSSHVKGTGPLSIYIFSLFFIHVYVQLPARHITTASHRHLKTKYSPKEGEALEDLPRKLLPSLPSSSDKIAFPLSSKNKKQFSTQIRLVFSNLLASRSLKRIEKM